MQARGSDSDEDALFGTPGPPHGGSTWPREAVGTGDGDVDRLLLSLAEHVLSQSGHPNPSSQEVRMPFGSAIRVSGLRTLFTSSRACRCGCDCAPELVGVFVIPLVLAFAWPRLFRQSL